MNGNFYQGELVELIPMDLDNHPALWEQWNRDTDYQRLLSISPASHSSADVIKEWFSDEPQGALFSIKTRTEGTVIGFVELDGYDWTTRNAWVAIAIGDMQYRGKGYGTEAMELLLKFAFLGLNMHRVSLTVFDFNKRAIRSYEKAGFRYEGTLREMIYKEDQRWDVLAMGIMRSEWDAFHAVREEEEAEAIVLQETVSVCA